MKGEELAQAPRLLEAVVGSTAYGLATASSDVDLLAVATLPVEAFLGLRTVTGAELTYHQVGESEDVTVHEVGKFLSLCVKANPSVTELLWLPAESYRVRTEAGEQLLGLRETLLSRAVKDAYLGYAAGQVKKAKTGQRLEKSSRHTWRLVHSGLQLWREGRLQVRLPEDAAEECRAFGAAAAQDLTLLDNLLAQAIEAFCAPTPLPVYPDYAAANDWLVTFRSGLL